MRMIRLARRRRRMHSATRPRWTLSGSSRAGRQSPADVTRKRRLSSRSDNNNRGSNNNSPSSARRLRPTLAIQKGNHRPSERIRYQVSQCQTLCEYLRYSFRAARHGDRCYELPKSAPWTWYDVDCGGRPHQV